MNKNSIFSLSILLGTIIGAGIFGLPYVILKSGLLPGLFYFLALGTLVTLLHLFYGEVVLRTSQKSRLAGHTEKYLGKGAKSIVTFSIVFGAIGSLLAYIILAGDFLKIIMPSFIGFSSSQYTLIFGLVLSYFVFHGLKLIAPIEVLTNSLFLLIIVFIFSLSLSKITVPDIRLINIKDIFLPYGVILFSFIGTSAIPEMSEILKNPTDKKHIKKIIILATGIVFLLYIFFTAAVIGVSGQNTSSNTFDGLLPFLGKRIIFWGALAGMITIADSFLVIALYLKNTFIYDFKLNKTLASLISCGLPLFLFLIGFRSFIEVIGFVGTIIGVIEGMIIILLFKKAKKMGDREPEYSLKVPSFLIYFLMLILIMGAVSQIFYYLK